MFIVKQNAALHACFVGRPLGLRYRVEDKDCQKQHNMYHRNLKMLNKTVCDLPSNWRL